MPSRSRPKYIIPLGIGAAVLWPALAWGEPQASFGVTGGAALRGVAGPGPSSGVAFLGGRGDVLFGASGPAQMAEGPYVDVSTEGFANVNAGAGAEWALPVTVDFPLVLGGGGFVRTGNGPASPGLAGSLFFGPRSYNFHSWYGLAAGLFAQTLWTPGTSALDVVVGVQVDAELLVLPFLLAYDGIVAIGR